MIAVSQNMAENCVSPNKGTQTKPRSCFLFTQSMMLLKNSSILVRTGILKARKTLCGCQIMSNPFMSVFFLITISGLSLNLCIVTMQLALPLLWFDRFCLLLSLCAGNDSVADCRQISSQGNMCSAALLVLCAMCSP